MKEVKKLMQAITDYDAWFGSSYAEPTKNKIRKELEAELLAAKKWLKEIIDVHVPASMSDSLIAAYNIIDKSLKAAKVDVESIEDRLDRLDGGLLAECGCHYARFMGEYKKMVSLRNDTMTTDAYTKKSQYESLMLKKGYTERVDYYRCLISYDKKRCLHFDMEGGGGAGHALTVAFDPKAKGRLSQTVYDIDGSIAFDEEDNILAFIAKLPDKNKLGK